MHTVPHAAHLQPAFLSARRRFHVTTAGALLAMLLITGASAQPLPGGEAFTLISRLSGGAFEIEDVVAAPNGGFVVVMRDGYGGLPAVRRFDANGRPTAPVRRIEPWNPRQFVEHLRVAAAPNGDLATVWQARRVDTTYDYQVIVRLMNGADERSTIGGFVNTIHAGDQVRPVVAAAPPPAGGFLVVWEHELASDTEFAQELHARWVDATGMNAGQAFVVTPDRGDGDAEAAVAIDAHRNVMVAWHHTGAGGYYVGARFFDPFGNPYGAEMQLSAPFTDYVGPAEVVATDDGFVAAWPTGSGPGGGRVVAQRFSSRGEPGPTLEAAIGESSPVRVDLAADSHGNLVAAYGGNDGARGVTFDFAAGTASASAIFAPDGSVPHLVRAAASTPGGSPMGGFLAAWNASEGGAAIRGQALTLCGNAAVDGGETCDDANRFADDCCSPTCATEPVAGRCFRLAGTSVLRLTATVSANGRTADCKARCRAAESGHGTLIVLDDGTYRWPQGAITCGEDVARLPDETGRIRGRGDTLRLRAGDLGGLRDALRVCTGLRLRSTRATVEDLDAAGGSGTQHVHIRRPGSPPIHSHSVTRFSLVPFEARRQAVAPDVSASIPICDDQVELRCRLR